MIIQSFVPVSQDNQQLRLVSFLTAKADRRNYGQLDSFVMPQGQLVDGPVQAALKINQDAAIASRFTLLDQQGSQLIRGTRAADPGRQLDHLRAADLRGERGHGPVPRVPVRRDVRPGPRPGAGRPRSTRASPRCSRPPWARPPTETTPTPTTPGTGSASDTVEGLLRQAAEKFTAADAALRAGDLGGYQTLVKEAQNLVNQAQQQLNAGSVAAPSTSSTSTTTSSTTSTTRAGFVRPDDPTTRRPAAVTGLSVARGIVTIGVVEIPRRPPSPPVS